MNFALKISFLDLIFFQMTSEISSSRSFWMILGSPPLSQKVFAVVHNP